MAIIALHSASTGLSALSTSLDVIANNLANANTDGFKSSRANFQDLLYAERAQPGTENANGDQIPGVEVDIIWDSGFDHFFTGLKPDLGAGYGDFTMTGGVVFTLFVEICFPYLVWLPRWRGVMLSAAVVLHLSIALFMGLVTFSLIMLTAVLAFVPYQNLRNVKLGTKLYSCSWGLVMCSRVGEVTQTIEGEVENIHPHDESVQRGIMVEIKLTTPSAEGETVLFAGGKPLYFF